MSDVAPTIRFMASIRKRVRGGKTRFQVRWREDGVARSVTFATNADAIEFRGLVDAAGQRLPAGYQLGRGFVEPERPRCELTVAQWCERSIESRSGVEARTRHDYLAGLRRHLGDLTDIPIDQLTREQIGLWIIDLSEKLSPKSIANLQGIVSSCLTDAMNQGLIPRNPAKGIRLPRSDGPDAQKMVVLSSSEIEMIWRAVDNESYSVLIDFLGETGARFSEVTALTVEQLDLFNCVVTIDRAFKRQPDSTFVVGPPKTRKANRAISITRRLRDRLVPLVAGKSGAELVFSSPDGAPVRHSNFRNRVWLPTIKSLNFCASHRGPGKRVPCGCPGTLSKSPRIHDLRHSHITHLIKSGVPMAIVSVRAGHESIQTSVDTYGHFAPADEASVLAALGQPSREQKQSAPATCARLG